MAPKSCRKIEVLVAADAIMGFIGATKEPVSIADMARATGLSVDSCFRQIGTMEELRWVTKIGTGYILGGRISELRARKVAALEAQRDAINKQLTELQEE
ncbi:MAG: helix-turn-helix domain-containing protein [Smithellaceae bacterium]|nr:helix-turn-helix domain-containing protein [Smithellaceae bacterium]